MNIFVSSEDIKSLVAQSLILRLRKENHTVFHSPINPLDGDDSRWQNWYEKGLKTELGKVETFVSIITYSWASSTWMAFEIDEAFKLLKPNNIYFWNPDNFHVKALGMIGYLKNELPVNLDDLMKFLSVK
jgi:hypothetical protein